MEQKVVAVRLGRETEQEDGGVMRVGHYSRESFEAAAVAPGIIRPPPPATLGSRAGNDGEGRYTTYDFLEGNKLLLTHGGKTRQGAWKLTGNQVTMEAASDEGTEKYIATVEGWRMSGTYTVGSRTVRWEATAGAPAETVGVGVGMQLDKDQRLIIDSVMGDSPAARAGLKKGDVIVEIDGQSTVGMPMASAVALIRGQAGTPVKLKILMPDRNRTFEVSVLREAFKR